MTVNDDDLADRAATVLRVLELAAAGDGEGSIRLLHSICSTTDDVWAACCAIARTVTEHAKSRASPEADGPLLVDVNDIPGATVDPAMREAVERAAAFIAAIGNDDAAGAHLMFTAAGDTEEEAGAFVAHLVLIAAAAYRHARQHDDEEADHD